LIASGRTEDGFGMAFGVNHLGHFLLTLLLLDRLKQAEHSRVVNVSALLHRLGSVDFNLLNTHKDLVTGHLLPQQTLQCALYPGRASLATACIQASSPLRSKLLFLPMSKLFFMDPEGGAQTTLYCTLQEGLEPLSGRYFSSCALQNVSAYGRDDALAKKLWEVSERLCGLS
ncbi:hypothetical protein M9458_029825, partial [Cirrhinus mrigala]